MNSSKSKDKNCRRKLFTGWFSKPCYAIFLTQPRHTRLKINILTVGSVLSYQSLFKKLPHIHPQRPVCNRYFLNWDSVFQSDSSLYIYMGYVLNVNICLLGNIFFHTLYFDFGLWQPKASQILPTSSPIQIHILSSLLSLYYEQPSKNMKIIIIWR